MTGLLDLAAVFGLAVVVVSGLAVFGLMVWDTRREERRRQRRGRR